MEQQTLKNREVLCVNILNSVFQKLTALRAFQHV